MMQVQILLRQWTEIRRRESPYNPQHSVARGTSEGAQRAGIRSGQGCPMRAAAAVSHDVLGRELTGGRSGSRVP
jgi:hypothetical protein